VFDVGRPGDAVLRLSTQDGSMVEVPVAVHERPDWRGGWPWEAVIEPGTVRAELVASSRTTRVTRGGGRSEQAGHGLTGPSEYFQRGPPSQTRDDGNRSSRAASLMR
jgi:hypothetical protein